MHLKYIPPYIDYSGRMGYVLEMWRMMEGKTILGYLRMAYMTSESWARFNATPLHYKATRGWCVSCAAGMTDLEVFAAVQRYLTPYSAPTIPSDDTEALEEALATYKDSYKYEAHRQEWLKDRAYFVNRPYVDYAHVVESHRRQGIATALYRRAAEHFATRGMTLRASTIRSDDAVGLWESFESKGWTESHMVGKYLTPSLMPEVSAW